MADAQPDILAIFTEAVRHESPAERSRFLDEACGSDPMTRQRVETLLRAHFDAGNFLGGHSSEATPAIDQPVIESPGTQIGPYKLLQQIGEGGFGVVYMAEQLEPVRRKVALKIIKPGMDTRQVIARFEAERQALAVMDHPNIARVLDAGATESGRPYFVMELVRGTPITQYCDENCLPIRERLALFATVCQAIQHAHTKGIIHRDIKPTNVLVTRQDGQSVVKVIDFGVAKAMGQQLTDKTLFTEFAQMIGTPLYMSPEQAELSSTDIDTRSDIYSLGVLLYELLTGTTPVSKEQLMQAAFDEIRRIIREEDPPKPSTRISTAEAAPSIAAQRHTEPAKLAKLVRGELDWIVMKALEKDRSRRYETASSFATDIQHFLNDEAVVACPPSAAYRFRKFARRNRVALSTASVVLAVLIVGIFISTWEAIRATHAEDLAEKRLKAETEAKGRAIASQIEADKQRKEAFRQSSIATANEKRAKEQERLARRRFYAAQTNLALQAWEAGQSARTLELLETLRPKADEEDLRGFEWYYLWRLCHRNLYRTLRGPAGATVHTVAITPDGKTVLSGSRDATVRVWDAATGKERAVLSGHTSLIWRLAISPDGKRVASASLDQTVKLWDLETDQLLATFDVGHTGMGRSVAFSPDGNVLAVGTEFGTLEFWDVGARKRRLALPARSAPVIGLAYSPDGKMLATVAGWNTSQGPGGVTIWDVTSEPPRVIFRHETYSSGVAFSPDSSLLATCGHYGAKLWSAPAGEVKATLDSSDSSIESVAFSAEGNMLVLGGADRTVKLWEFGSGATRTVGVHLGEVNAVAFVPQTDLLASGSADGTVKLWYADRTLDAANFIQQGAIQALGFTPDSKLLLVGSDRRTAVLDATTGQQQATVPVSGVLAVSADAKLLAARAGDQRVIWDVAAARARAILPVGPEIHTAYGSGAAFSRDDRTLLTWIGDPDRTHDGAVRLWDLNTSRVRATLNPRGFGMVMSGALSPDGKKVATARLGGSVTLWDATSGQQGTTLQAPEGATNGAIAVAFSNAGKLLAAGNKRGALRLWDVETGQLNMSFKGHTEEILSVAFSPDDKTLLSGSRDRTARLWDVVTGQELLALKGHKFPVALVAFALDGKRVATASGDRTETESGDEVKLWLAATEPEVMGFHGAFELKGKATTGNPVTAEEKPSDAGGWLRRGELRARRGDWEGARQDFFEFIDSRPDDLALLSHIANFYLGHDRGQEAAAVYDRAIEKSPSNAELKARRGQLKPGVVAVWNFDAQPEDWGAPHECTVSASDGILHIQVTGEDPWVIVPVAALAGWKELTLHVRASQECQAQLFWDTDRSPGHAQERSVFFDVKPGNGEFFEFKVRFRADSALKSLRLDPVWREQVHWEIDAATLANIEPPADVTRADRGEQAPSPDK